jgi:cellulose synthase/poly-beta-1,6-N-acetylglucosamine synthase-like glycosyltransferase
MQCLLIGVPASWSHVARIYDEKPEGFVASSVQRLRWARGHWDVCFKYTPKLLWRFITKLDIRAFDGALYLINPGKIVLGALTGMIIWLSILTDNEWFDSIIPWQVWVMMVVFQFSYVAWATKVDANKKINVLWSYICLFFFNVTYIPLFIWSLLTFKNKSWNPTKHTRGIELDNVDETVVTKLK